MISRLRGGARLSHHASMQTHQEAAKKRSIPTVSRVIGDTLVELIYDPVEAKTGLVVSRFKGLWNIEQELETATGEFLVPYSSKNNLIATNCVLLPSKPEPHGSKKELLKDIEAFLHRYVDFSPTFEKISAHYVLLSWVHDAFSEIPYMRLRGAYGSGKTRGLLAIGSLCYRPFFASGASTVSPIFHTLDRVGGTLVLDEADFRFSDATSDIVKILNNGNVKGLPVLRTMQNRDKEYNPRAFRVFGPKIIAMRGSFEDQALESRFLTEEMGLRPFRKDIPIAVPESLHNEALTLRNRLLHYRLCHFFDVKPRPEALLEGLEPRINQIALPLLSIIDDPKLREEIRLRLLREQQDRLQERGESAEGKLVAALHKVMEQSKGRPPGVGAIAEEFNRAAGNAYGRAVTEKWVGHMLRTRLRLSTQKSHGVYVVPIEERPKIDALAARYNVEAGERPQESNKPAITR